MEFNLMLKNNNVTDAIRLVKGDLNRYDSEEDKIKRLDSILASIETIRTIETICKLEKEAIIKSLLKEPKETVLNKESKYGDINWLCEFLGVEKQTVYGYNSARKYPFTKKGKKVIYNKAEIMELVGQNRFKSQDEIRAETIKEIPNLRKTG